MAAQKTRIKIKIKQVDWRHIPPLEHKKIKKWKRWEILPRLKFHHLWNRLKCIRTVLPLSIRILGQLQHPQIRIKKSPSLISISSDNYKCTWTPYNKLSIIVLVKDVPLVKFVLAQLRHLDVRYQGVVLVLHHHVRHQLVLEWQLYLLSLHLTIFTHLCLEYLETFVYSAAFGCVGSWWGILLWRDRHLFLHTGWTTLSAIVALCFLDHRDVPSLRLPAWLPLASVGSQHLRFSIFFLEFQLVHLWSIGQQFRTSSLLLSNRRPSPIKISKLKNSIFGCLHQPSQLLN